MTDPYPLDFELPQDAVLLGRLDNSSIEAMVLSVWKLPEGEVLAVLEDTFPYEAPQIRREVFGIEAGDRFEIQRRGSVGERFAAIDTRVVCYRGAQEVWHCDFEINSHWGGISDDEVITGIESITKYLGLILSVHQLKIN